METNLNADLEAAISVQDRCQQLEAENSMLRNDLLFEQVRRREVEFNSARCQMNFLAIIRIALVKGLSLNCINLKSADEKMERLQLIADAAFATASKLARDRGLRLQLRDLSAGIKAFDVVED